MEVAFPSSPPTKHIGNDRLTEITMDFSKLGFTEKEEEIRKLERSWSQLEESVKSNDEDDDEEEEEEFSFACVNTEESQITADEAFKDGQIRPFFPLFNSQNDDVLVIDDDRPRVRKLFVEDRNGDGGQFNRKNDDVSVNDGDIPRVRKLFVEDRNGNGEDDQIRLVFRLFNSQNDNVSVTNDDGMPRVRNLFVEDRNGNGEEKESLCRKSNSTGFSKLWRFRDLVLRSNSDGRDAFVFLNNDKTQSSSSSAVKKTTSSSEKKKKIKTVTKSAHEKLYMRNRAKKEEVKHKSYLPYKQVGFFTNVNVLSKNIHPF